MNTIEKLSAYRKKLERWNSKRKTYEAQFAENQKIHPFIEAEPMPKEFEIADNDEWAMRIRRDVVEKPIPAPVQILLVKKTIPKRKI